MHDVYISHNSSDKVVAEAICATLERAGTRCWMAPRDIPPGSGWGVAIAGAIESSRVMVLVYSSNAAKSEHIKREVERALDRGLIILPFRTEHIPLVGGLEFLFSTPTIDGFTPPLEARLGDLTRSVADALSRKRHPPKPPPPQPPPRPVPGHSTPRDNVPVRTSDHIEQYDVFISYRRDAASAEARAIRAELNGRQWRVFLDMDDLRAGQFDEALREVIRKTPNFVVILSPQALERCSQPADWLRQEVAEAIRTERCIVPIRLPGFEYPKADELPDDIRALHTHHSLSYSHEYFESMIARLIKNLRKD